MPGRGGEPLHADVRRLLELMPPHVGAGDSVDWQVVQRSLGVRLPGDFRDFVGVFGAGTIDDQLDIARVADTGGDVDLPTIEQLTPTSASTAWLEATESGYPLWPAPGSLLCWGRLRSVGDTFGFLYWLTVGDDPDNWPVVTWNLAQRNFRQHPPGMAAYLVDALEGAAAFPLHHREVFGAPYSRFVHWREQQRLEDVNVDPWEYLWDLHDAYIEAGGEDQWVETGFMQWKFVGPLKREEEDHAGGLQPAVVVPADTGPGATVLLPEGPQVAVLGLTSVGGVLQVSASVVLGLPSLGELRLSGPLGVSVEVSGPGGLVAAGFDLTAEGAASGSLQGAEIVVTGVEPVTFNVRVPGSALMPGQDWAQVLRGSMVRGGAYAVHVVVRNPAVGAYRAALGLSVPAGGEDVIVGTWPPPSA
jgi:hypothetical protein